MQLTIYEAARREERGGADGGEPARDSNNQSIFISFRTRLAAAAQKKPRQLEIIQSHRVRCAPREGETQKERERDRKKGRERGSRSKERFELRFIPKAIFAFVVPKSDSTTTTRTTKPDNDNDKNKLQFDYLLRPRRSCSQFTCCSCRKRNLPQLPIASPRPAP